jgi:cysteine desulfurase
MTREIYLDNAATTRPWPEVRSAMLRAMDEAFGNASSRHSRGLHAAREIEQATDRILTLVGSGNWKIVFTSGGTESNNLAVAGTVPRGPRTRIITSSVEHASVAKASAAAAPGATGCIVVSAGRSGVVDAKAFAAAVTDNVALVTLTGAANEMGTVQPVNEVATHVKARNDRLRMHVDAVQAAAQIERLDFSNAVDMVSLSAHKIHGPQGIGALLLRPGISLRPSFFGGDQQNGLRPGTLNLPGIVGFGVAAELTALRREIGVTQMRVLSEKLITGICEDSRTRLLGAKEHRASGLAVVAVKEIPSEVLLHVLELQGVIASAGSACHASRSAPPACLTDAGLRADEGTLRFSLSFDTTPSEIDCAIRAFHEAVKAIRAGHTGDLK